MQKLLRSQRGNYYALKSAHSTLHTHGKYAVDNIALLNDGFALLKNSHRKRRQLHNPYYVVISPKK